VKKIILVFSATTCGYHAHAMGCSAAVEKRDQQYLLPQKFDSVESARKFANEDEQEKGGERAIFKACPCVKGRIVKKNPHRQKRRSLLQHWANAESQRIKRVRTKRAKRVRAKNPRMAVLLAQRPGGPVLKYLGGMKFAAKGHGVLFHSAKSALALGRQLKAQFPALTRYKLFAR
jgi:hypothetical protein